MAVERIRKAILTSDLTQAEIARRVTEVLGRSIDRSMINKIAKDKRDVSADEADALEHILKLEADARRLGTAERREGSDNFERIETDGVFSEGVPYEPKIDGAMPELDFEAGAGEGRAGELYQIALGNETYSGHRVVAEWKFSEEWLRSEVRSSAKRTIVVPVIGDSMRGSFDHGDRVLVDLDQNAFIDGVVFVILVDGGEPSIKRLAEVYEAKPRRWTVISDNPAIPNREVPASIVTILGRVVGRVSRQ